MKTTAPTSVGLAIGLLLLCSGGAQAGQRPSPVVWGRSLEQWQAAAANPNPHVREHALAALERLGRRATVALPTIEKALSDPVQAVRLRACRALAGLGPRAVPRLLDRLDSSDLREPALAALQHLGDEAIPGLLRTLRTGEVRRRRQAALVIASFRWSRSLELTVPPDALRDADGLVRVRIASALLKQDESTRPAVRVLIEALSAQDQETRLEAAAVMARFASHSAEAVAPLEKALRTATGVFRVRVASALWRIDSEAAGRAFRLLLDAAQDRDEEVCREALEALTELRDADTDEAEAALPVLVAVLKERHRRQPRTVLAAVRTLLVLGRDAQPTLPVLLAMLREDSPTIAEAVARELPAVAPKDGALVPALVRALAHPDSRVRIAAADALGGLGDADAVTPLTDLLKAGDPRVVVAAAEALHRLAPEKADALLPVLIRCLRDDGSEVHAKALAVLESMDSGGVLALARALREGDRDTRRTAAATLGHSEFFLSEDPRFAGGRRSQLADSWGAVPALKQALRDSDADVRILAASALAGWDPRTKGVASLLSEGLHSPDVLVRERSLWGLFSLGPRGQALLPEVLRVLSDPEEADLHLLSLRVLGRMGPEARAAVPALLHCLHDRPADRRVVLELLSRLADREHTWRPLAEALLFGADDALGSYVWNRFTDIQGPAVPALLRALGSNDPDRQRRAAALLGALRPEGREVVAGLSALLEDRSPAVRVQAAGSLVATDPQGPGTAQALFILTRAARHAEDGLRHHAVQHLLSHASAWEGLKTPVVPTLMRELLHDPDAEVRQQALRFFAGTKPPDFAATLVQALGDQDTRVRRQAADLLGFCGPEARVAIPSLVESLGSKDGGLRSLAVQALRRHGQEDGTLANALLRTYRKTRSKGFRKDLIWALGGMGKGSLVIVPAFREIVQDPDWITEDWALDAWNAVDPGNPLILPALAEVVAADFPAHHLAAKNVSEFGPGLVADLGRLVRRGKATQRLGAVMLLGHQGKQALSATPVLRQALGDEDGRVRLEAVRALWEVTKHGEAAVGVLRDLLKGKDVDLRRRAASLLGEMHAAAREAVPDLVACLKSRDRRLAHIAVASLGEIGQAAPAAVPALLELVRGDDPFLRCAAVDSMGAFGPEARPAIPDLQRLLQKGPTPNDQASSARCLGKIATAAEAGPAVVTAFREEAAEDEVTDLLAGLGQALRKFGPALREEIDKLLHDCRARVRARTLGLFHHGDFGAGEKDVLPFLPALLEAFLDADDDVAFSALRAVGGGSHLRDTLSVLRRGVKAKETAVRVRSIRFLGWMEGEAREAIPDLLALARDDNVAIREAALAALKEIDPDAARGRKP
jgi:HEAT repeat protein